MTWVTFYGGNERSYNTQGWTQTQSGDSGQPGSDQKAGTPTNAPVYNVPDAPLQTGAQQFAALINPAMTRVLRLMADGMSTVGVYIALLNNAGQIYTASDKHSAVPPAPIPGGKSLPG